MPSDESDPTVGMRANSACQPIGVYGARVSLWTWERTVMAPALAPAAHLVVHAGLAVGVLLDHRPRRRGYCESGAGGAEEAARSAWLLALVLESRLDGLAQRQAGSGRRSDGVSLLSSYELQEAAAPVVGQMPPAPPAEPVAEAARMAAGSSRDASEPTDSQPDPPCSLQQFRHDPPRMSAQLPDTCSRAGREGSRSGEVKGRPERGRVLVDLVPALSGSSAGQPRAGPESGRLELAVRRQRGGWRATYGKTSARTADG